MLYVFYGPDTVSARDKVGGICSKKGVSLQSVGDVADLSSQNSDDLFGTARAYLLRNTIKNIKKSDLEPWVGSTNLVFFIESNLTEKQKKDLPSGIVLEEFAAKAGLLGWLEERAVFLGVELPKGVGQYILQRLGFAGAKFGPTSDTFLRLHQELMKLSAYSGNGKISLADIDTLIASEEEGFAFTAVDAVISGNANVWIREFERIYSQEDEAGASILLVGAFAETFRAIHSAQVALAEKVSMEKLASDLGWPDWKLRKVRSLTARVPIQKTIDTLNKLLALDNEIKTSGLPPRAVLTLIAAVAGSPIV